MSRLPAPLQPLWPVVKVLHRRSTRVVGAMTRRTTALAGSRAVPVRATTSSAETARQDPQRVRLHGCGPGEALRRTLPEGLPPEHRGLRRRASYDVPPRFVLDIDEGVVVGDYGAHIAPGGVLDFETSPYFGIDGWREHPLYLRRRLPRPDRVEGTVLSLASPGAAANYYHFLWDVLPRWGIFRECLPELAPDAYYLHAGTSYQRQLLTMVGLPERRCLTPDPGRAVSAERLLVPSHPNPDLIAPSWTSDWLRRALPPRRREGLPRRIYLTRGNRRNSRRLVDEARHVAMLEDYGFTVFDAGRHSVQDQIDAFAAAQVIVAPHGAALANLAFCSPGVRVLELFAHNYVNPCYWVIADNVPGSTYHYLAGDGRGRHESTPLTGVLTDIRIHPEALRAAVERLLAAG